jgi:hypothetical protein
LGRRHVRGWLCARCRACAAVQWQVRAAIIVVCHLETQFIRAVFFLEHVGFFSLLVGHGRLVSLLVWWRFREKEMNAGLIIKMIDNQTWITDPDTGEESKPFAFDFSM